jgi:hypothetical protein
MVIMKMLSNKKGIALVILIIAMTLIAILGAGVVSFMGAKQRGYPFQLNSYKALNIANAGVEYAIRYASDASLADSNNFFLSPTITKIFPTSGTFSDGTFNITYNYNRTDLNQDYVDVVSNYNGMNRTVRLRAFRRYVSSITLVPDSSYRPYKSDKLVVIPLINNNENSEGISITSVALSVVGGGNKVLDDICFGSDEIGGCLTPAGLGKSVQQDGTQVILNKEDFDGPYSIARDTIDWCILQFQDSNVTGNYTMTFTLSGIKPSTVKFPIN